MVVSTDLSHRPPLWTHCYGRTTAVSATLTYLHLGGVLLGGGVAIAADAATLRLSPETGPDSTRELDRLAAVHRWVVAGLTLIFASGVVMMLAKVGSVATSAVFWVKLGLVVLLIVTGYARPRVEVALRQGSAARWGRLRSP